MIKHWIEAMRLRTLPVSISGVVAALAFALLSDGPHIHWGAAMLCLAFAVLAQIASNFANEYYDFRAGMDRPGREGPRRGVTEGDITPRAMLTATFTTLAIACAIGCSLIYWGGWWLLPAGILIALGVLAYSTGPYPLSHHGLGEVAVAFFFGIIPVNLTYYIVTGTPFDTTVAAGSLSIGLLGANVLIVNNYRDRLDDAAVGKRTLAVIAGQRIVSALYLINGYIAIALMVPFWMAIALTLSPLWYIAPLLWLGAHTLVWYSMQSRAGAALNPLLGITAMLMFAYTIMMLLPAIAL